MLMSDEFREMKAQAREKIAEIERAKKHLAKLEAEHEALQLKMQAARYEGDNEDV